MWSLHVSLVVKRIADILQSYLLLWGVTLIVMLEDDAAMLALMFC